MRVFMSTLEGEETNERVLLPKKHLSSHATIELGQTNQRVGFHWIWNATNTTMVLLYVHT
jgi:hypothetical protein